MEAIHTQWTFAQDTYMHTHRQQIIIIYTPMATDMYSRITAFKNEMIKGKMKRQIKLYRVIDFATLSCPPRKLLSF